MGCLFFLVIFSLVAWADFAMVRALLRSRASPPWWGALIVLLVAGLVAGVWCGFFCEYQVSPSVRVAGFPVAVALFHLEYGQWVDYVTPAPLVVALLDALIVTLSSLLPLSLAILIRGRRAKRLQSTPGLVTPPTPALTWWEARRLRYNVGLLVAGVLAFICYVVVCCTLLPRVLDASQIKVTPFTTLFQGVGYLLMMGVANVCYFLGPLSESFLQPRDVERYRRVCYQLGFWFSVLLPFGIPAWLTILVVFFPGYW